MIGRLRKVVRFLESARLATWLLVVVGAWSVVASFVPQGGSSEAAVSMWAAAHPTLERVAHALGLHRAFSAPPFLACVLVLAVSTVLCAWRRTKMALGRMETLRESAARDAASLTETHNIAIVCDAGLEPSDALSTASETLARIGVKSVRRDGLLCSVSPWWSVWGSPIFHWGLVAMIVVILGGSLQRSEGMMGVAVGQSKPDAPASYGVLHAGPLHRWGGVHRSIRADAFETEFRAGDIDRGPTPTISVLDAQGKVIKTQRIYPNSPLQTGSLTIHPADFGFAAVYSLASTSGANSGRATQLIDISAAAPEGTFPLRALAVADRTGKNALLVFTTVALDRKGDELVVPEKRVAHVIVKTADGSAIIDRSVKPGETIELPAGTNLRLDDLGFYARLSVVDDGTIPFLYAAMAIAVLGLSIAVAARQQAILVTVDEVPDGLMLYASVHLWRNAATNRHEIQDELARALSGNEEDVS